MSDFFRKVSDFFGPASDAIGQVLVGLIILVVGLLVVKLIASIVSRALSHVGFLKRTDPDGTVRDMVSPIVSLVKAVLTIFVLMAVLQHFGLSEVLAPLRELANKFLSVIPNIVGAGIIFYAGWIIAKLVSELVRTALGKADQQIAKRTGNADIRVSKFGGAFVFIAILLPIVVAALGVLNIPAISEPASAMIGKLMNAVPNIIGAAIILLVTYLVARFVITMLSALLEGMGINALPGKLGLRGLFSESFTPMKLISGAIMFFSMLAAATAAVNMLGIEVISVVFAKVLEFGGGILVGIVILVIGNFLSALVYDKMTAAGTSGGLANIARFAILGLVVTMGLKAMGLADNIVTLAFGLTLGSVALAAAMAFGLGGRDAAKRISDHWAGKLVQRRGSDEASGPPR